MENELPKIEKQDVIKLPSNGSRISRKVMVLIVCFAFLALLTSGLAAYMISSSRKQTFTQANIPTQTFEPTPISGEKAANPTLILSTPTPSASPTPTLKNSYSNSKYGFSFRYPSGWTLVNKTQSDPKILLYLVLNSRGALSDELSITVSYGTRNYEEALDLNNQVAESIQVAGISSSRKILKDSKGSISIQVIIPDSNNTFIFLSKEKYKSTLDQILSSFKLDG